MKKAAAKKKIAPKKPAKKPVKKKSPASKKRPVPPGAGEELGRVVAFFRIPVVAVIRITRDNLKTGDRVWIKGHTTDLKLTLSSLQIDHQPISQAKKGNEVGVKVSSRVRIGDRVYRIAG